MKRLYYISILMLLCLTPSIQAQVLTENYIRTRTMRNSTGSEYLDHIQYYDGLGRPYLQVQKNGAGLGSHLAVLQEYDFYERVWQNWLPGLMSTDYLNPSTLKTQVSQHYNDTLAFTRTLYGGALVDKATSVSGPGEAWLGKAIRTDRLFNEASAASILACKKYIAADAGGGITLNGYYKANSLSVVRSTDEDGHTSYTFSNSIGQVLLVRQMNGALTHDTYSVYDSFGRLCFVLMPLYQESADLSLYAWRYRYDGKGRCIEKRTPGCEAVTYEYDSADRIIRSQDGRQRKDAGFTFYEYDAFGRPLSTMEKFNVIASGTPKKQSSTINYYDNYDFLEKPELGNIKTVLVYSELSGYGIRYINQSSPKISAQGQLTGTSVWLPELNLTIYTAYYYDKHGKLIQQRSNNQLGGSETDNYSYSFMGSVLKRRHVHTATGKTAQTEYYTYSYDHLERLTKVGYQLNGNPVVTLAENSYDELGRLSSRKRHGSGANPTSYTDNTTYGYNIRDWLTGITGGKFTQSLHYTSGTSTPCFSGNISSMTWKAGSETATRGYKYSYDGLGRLTSTVYGEGAALATNGGRFNESITSYDRNGNIRGLQRSGKTGASTYGMVDNLTMSYTGNLLQKTSDAVTAPPYGSGTNFIDGSSTSEPDYSYDGNGNLTKDLNKKISNIQYNCLNLPVAISFSTGDSIRYYYGGDGTRFRSRHKTGSSAVTTDYCRNVVYENGLLSKILTETGYITLSGTAPTYHYFLQDHQGNNRIVMKQDGSIEEANHYYPFGGLFGEGVSMLSQPYKYNGKELDMKNGLNWYDYGARYYDAALGRFTTMDPLAEKYYGMTPYSYCANTPINAIDPNGCSTWVIQNTDGTYRVIGGDLEDDDRNIYAYDFKVGEVSKRFIGITTSMTSFYNSDANEGKGAWANGSIIDPNDDSGRRFLDDFVQNTPDIGFYMENATGGKLYDFKTTNGFERNSNKKLDIYRGMQVSTNIYSSARDIGNFAAGYIAGIYGITWKSTRHEFDKLQSKQEGKPAMEGISSQNAQYLGWQTGRNDFSYTLKPIGLYLKTIPTVIKQIYK